MNEALAIHSDIFLLLGQANELRQKELLQGLRLLL
jgi:hypothetical protein